MKKITPVKETQNEVESKLLKTFYETLLEFNKYYIYPSIAIKESNGAIILTLTVLPSFCQFSEEEYYTIGFVPSTGEIFFRDPEQYSTGNNLSIQPTGEVYYTKRGKITNILQYVAGVVDYHMNRLRDWNGVPNRDAWKAFVKAHPPLEIESEQEIRDICQKALEN